jgi:hypothetical protein
VGWEIDSGKAAQRGRVVERILGAGIRQVEPVLQKVDAQHDRQADWLAAVACLGIMRLDQCFQLGPGNHRLHRLQKLLPAAGACKLFKTRLAGKCYLAHRNLHPHAIGCKHGAGG